MSAPITNVVLGNSRDFSTNVGARRFYERHGYDPVGLLSGLIAPGIDEVLYRKTVGPIRTYVPTE